MTTMSGDFDLDMDELREVARYLARAAHDLLGRFEEANPGDTRPRAAIAAAAYLHPIAKAHQVGHILRAAANAARIAEIEAGHDHRAASRAIGIINTLCIKSDVAWMHGFFAPDPRCPR